MNIDAIEKAQRLRCLSEEEAWSILGPILKDLPSSWKTMLTSEDGAMFRSPDGRKVLVSVAMCNDQRRWIHASISHPKRLPTYEDLQELHQRFIGQDRRALQVFAPRKEHINIHKNCLHLWACVEEDGLPDFSEGTGSI
jgi:hypothetical protein